MRQSWGDWFHCVVANRAAEIHVIGDRLIHTVERSVSTVYTVVTQHTLLILTAIIAVLLLL